MRGDYKWNLGVPIYRPICTGISYIIELIKRFSSIFTFAQGNVENEG